MPSIHRALQINNLAPLRDACKLFLKNFSTLPPAACFFGGERRALLTERLKDIQGAERNANGTYNLESALRILGLQDPLVLKNAAVHELNRRALVIARDELHGVTAQVYPEAFKRALQEKPGLALGWGSSGRRFNEDTLEELCWTYRFE